MRAFLGYLNREVLRPVTLSVHVYAVTMEREADYGIGLAATIAKLFGTSAHLAVSPESVAVVKPSAAVADTLAATVRALSRAGTVSRVLSADIPSLNGKPAQFFELYKEAYIKESRTTAGEGIAQNPPRINDLSGDCRTRDSRMSTLRPRPVTASVTSRAIALSMGPRASVADRGASTFPGSCAARVPGTGASASEAPWPRSGGCARA